MNAKFRPRPIAIGQHNASARRAGRRGGVLIAALVLLVLIATVQAVLMRGAFTRRGQLVRDERRVQAEWLLQSAVSRARARLQESDAYPGETWQLAFDEVNGRDAARVHLVVETPEGKPAQRRVVITVDLPPESEARERAEQTFLIPTGRSASGE